MLSSTAAVDACRLLLDARAAEADALERIHSYLHGSQELPILVTAGLPREVRQLAEMSRVNVIRLPIDVMAQSLFVDGFRQPDQEADEPVWDAWQANRMDARQTGIYRAALGYGVSYAIVTEGDPYPVIRGGSPRKVTTLYGEDPDWPALALEVMDDGSYRVYDDQAIYFLADGDEVPGALERPIDFLDASAHPFAVTPVVRFLNMDDLDGAPVGEVEPLIPLQDQVDHTTFDLLVAQHFAAFRQRYAIGWIAETESERLKTGPGAIWNFEDADVKVGEFGQTDIKGHLESREASLRHMAIVSQTPPHNLLGQMANLSAEALAAAEIGQRRKLNEKRTTFGESDEQLFQLVGVGMGVEVSADAQVRWRDSEARSLSQTADALTKLAEGLQVPVKMLWEMIPGWTQQDLRRAEALAAEGDAFSNLASFLDEQMGSVDPVP